MAIQVPSRCHHLRENTATDSFSVLICSLIRRISNLFSISLFPFSRSITCTLTYRSDPNYSSALPSSHPTSHPLSTIMVFLLHCRGCCYALVLSVVKRKGLRKASLKQNLLRFRLLRAKIYWPLLCQSNFRICPAHRDQIYDLCNISDQSLSMPDIAFLYNQ
ncbi:hypothetical protein DFS33DRAFT_771016 [Desarmillaria ectypa]|nr:hypothetical protein DFS33DRAFT_771016 [Desarmillaria ectypa]